MKAIKLVIILLLTSASLSSCSGTSSTSTKAPNETRKKTDLEQENLKGKIKIIKTIYDDAESLKSIKNVCLPVKCDEHKNSITYYDKKGNLTEKYDYYHEVNDCYENAWYEGYIYKYNDKGHKIEKLIYRPSKVLRERRSYRYNDEGELIEEIAFDTDSVLRWKKAFQYDKEKHTTHISWHKDDGSLDGKENYKYASQGGRLEKVEWAWYSVGDNFNGCKTYKYDNNENVIEETTYNTKNELMTKRTIRYDNQGNETEWLNYNIKDSIELRRTYEYKYDNQGNWIQRVTREDAVATGLVERQIVYYD